MIAIRLVVTYAEKFFNDFVGVWCRQNNYTGARQICKIPTVIIKNIQNNTLRHISYVMNLKIKFS